MKMINKQKFHNYHFETWTTDDGVLTAKRSFNWTWTITRTDDDGVVHRHTPNIVNNRAAMENVLNRYEFEKNHEQMHDKLSCDLRGKKWNRWNIVPV
tara:strand:+ start:231 stop:521 length:291 start_codon:yes stop_codon:yes gene_type:complete